MLNETTEGIKPIQCICHKMGSHIYYPKTLRSSVMESKAAYLWNYLIPLVEKNKLTSAGVLPTMDELIKEYGGLIGKDISFVFVELKPIWDTEVRHE